LSRLLAALPLEWALAFGRACGWLWYWVFPVRLGVARANLRRVFGATKSRAELRRILRRNVDHWTMYGVEILRLPSLTDERARELVRREGVEYLAAAQARGKGCVAVTAHMGSFDLLACSSAFLGIPVSVVFKDIAWKPARDFLFAVRERTGLRIIAPRRSRDEIRATLQHNGFVAFPVDQHMAPFRAIVCEFFGQLAATSPAPARFALETGASVITVHIEREEGRPGHHQMKIEPFELETPYGDLEANVRHNTERLNRVLEGWIRGAPDQWLWMHRRWKVHDDPTGWSIPAELWTKVGKSGPPPIPAPIEDPTPVAARGEG
jgi:KDO2-lipid IV(A) lauroyltransferase